MDLRVGPAAAYRPCNGFGDVQAAVALVRAGSIRLRLRNNLAYRSMNPWSALDVLPSFTGTRHGCVFETEPADRK